MNKFLKNHGALIVCAIIFLIQIDIPQKVAYAIETYASIHNGYLYADREVIRGMSYDDIDSLRKLDIYSDYDIIDNYNRHGIVVTNEVTKTISDFSGVAAGGLVQVYVGANSDADFTHPTYGLIGLAAHTKTQPGSIGYITWAQDFQVFGEYKGATAINHAGIRVLNGFGRINNQYGIFIDNQNVGSVSNFAINSEGGAWRIGGESSLIFGNGWYLRPDGECMKLYRPNGSIASEWN